MVTSCEQSDKRPRGRAFQPQSLKRQPAKQGGVTCGQRTSSYGAGRVGWDGAGWRLISVVLGSNEALTSCTQSVK